MKKKFALVLFLLCSVVTLSAGNMFFKGLVQNWFSFTDQKVNDSSAYGFTNKRLRLIPYGTFGENIKWAVHLAFDRGTINFYDVFIEYKFSDSFALKMGKFAAPGAISGGLTSSAALDLVERTPITLRWNGFSGLHGFRAFGVQVHGKLMDSKIYYALMLANPKATTYFTPSIKASSFKNDEKGMALWGRLEAKPMEGLRVGAFFGSSTATNSKNADIKRSSFGAHIFYNKSNINFKMEYIGGDSGGVEYNGMGVVFGYKLSKKFEPIVRYDFITPKKTSGGRYTNIGFGVNYWYSKNIKYQANYLLRSEELVDVANNIFYVNFQYSFNNK